MKRILVVFISLLMFSIVHADLNTQTITNQLEAELLRTAANDLIRVNISLKDSYDSDRFSYSTKGLTKKEKREFVTEELKSFSAASQKNVLNILSNAGKQNNAKNVIRLWINNKINCNVTPAVIEILSHSNDIKSIDLDEKRKMIIENNVNKSEAITPVNREITWNVTHVDADDVWALDYTGAGVLVAVLDSGVRYTHVDLADHVWDGSGAGYPNHGYDFANSDNDPMDDHSHGTHCAGTVAGDGTYASQTGIAPDATIMALKVLDSAGSGTESGTWNAIQFAVNHDADIMSMSIGWQHSWGVDREGWRDAMNNAVAAGVIAAVAAGNEGNQTGTYPIPDNVRSPGDVPPPWLNPDQTLVGGTSAVVCVGATDSNDAIAYFSSRGPVTWGSVTNYNDYAYPSQMGLIRPDLSAPGMNIKSLDYGSDTGYADGWNGTSMATPCVAGVMALMVQKNPNITPAQINQILETTVDIQQSPKNNTFGSGRVNALSAVNAVTSNGEPMCSITNPSNNDVIEIGTTVSIIVDATDPSRSVSNVKIYIDNVLKTTDYSSPYTYSWNTSSETLDFHTIKATATDNEAFETDHEITVRIANPTYTIFEDGFETGLGWINDGEFERGVPTGIGGVLYGNPDPSTAYNGSNVLGVDLSGIGTNAGDYEPSMLDRAYTSTSPIINCTDYENVSLSFYRWLNVERDTYDHAYIDAYDGATWQTVWENGGTTIEDNSWTQYTYDLSASADGNANFRIRFCMGSTDTAWQYSGWNIDDVVISGEGLGQLNTPTNVQAQIVGTNVQLSWDVVPDATIYHIFYSTEPYIGFTELDISVTNSYIHSGGAMDAKLFYYITAE